MDHGGEAPRPTTVESTDLGAAQGGEANMSTGTFHGQLGAAAARRAAAYRNSAEFGRHVRAATGGAVAVAVFHREPESGVVYANIGVFLRWPGAVGVVLVGLQLPGGVMPVHDNYYGCYALQIRPGSGRGVVLADQLPGGGAVYNGDYALQPHPGAEHDEGIFDLFPVPDTDEHREVFVGLLPSGGGAVHGDYDYYPWQQVLVGGAFDGLGNFARQTLLGSGRADGIGGMLRDPNLGAEHDTSGTLADDLGAVYDDPGMAFEHLRRLLGIVGIGACSVPVNTLATSPGSPAVAFHLFMLLLGGLFLVIMHVLRV